MHYLYLVGMEFQVIMKNASYNGAIYIKRRNMASCRALWAAFNGVSHCNDVFLRALEAFFDSAEPISSQFLTHVFIAWAEGTGLLRCISKRRRNNRA
jgi:hypothetical protein